MTGTIDVQGLPDEQVKLIEEFVNFLRERTMKADTKAEGKDDGIAFADWPLGVKGRLGRQEIYDHL